MQRIGKYIVGRELVRTDLSDIYLCVDPDLEMDVAVKVFSLKAEGQADNADYGPTYWLTRFVQEARLLASLDHPHIVPVRELSATEDGRPYFVMPFLPAVLADEIGTEQAPRALAPERAADLFRQLLDALAYLHGRQLVHRDVKPGNLLLTRRRGGAVKLCDFGMVKFPDWSLSRSGVWLGTLDYIAPEQRRDAQSVDARADVYSASAVVYRMLTGTMPVGAFPAPQELVPAIPQAFGDLVMRGLAREPDVRPRDGAEMRRLLDMVLAGGDLPRAARPPVAVPASVRKAVLAKAPVVAPPPPPQRIAKVTSKVTIARPQKAPEPPPPPPPVTEAPPPPPPPPSPPAKPVRQVKVMRKEARKVTLRHKDGPSIAAPPPAPRPADPPPAPKARILVVARRRVEPER